MTDKKNKDPITKFYEYLSKVKGISDRSIYHYLTYHRHFMDQEITQKSINNFLQSKNNNTVCRSYLKTYLEYKGLHKQFEIPKARSGTTKKRMIRYITRHEIKKVISQAYERGLKQGIMIDLQYYGALRRSEVLTIRTNSFKWDDLSKDYVKLKITGKGKKDRNVLIPTQTVRKILFIYMKRGMINDHMERDDIITKLSFIDDPLIKYTEKGIWRIIR